MRSDKRRTVAPYLAVVVSLSIVAGAAATLGIAGGAHSAALPRRASTLPPATAIQDPSAIEASLRVNRPTRRSIQQGLRNEGFDPGEPDGLFGPRTRAAIRRWQEARGVPPTGYLSRTDADRLMAAGAPPAPSRSITVATTAAPDSTASPAPELTAHDGTDPQPPAANNPASAAVEPPRTAEGTFRPEPPPDGPPATRPTAPSQLPPAILLDSYLLRAEQSVRDDDSAGARAAMMQIDALQAEHDLEIPANYHHRYARVWSAVANWERSQASAVRYLELTGRDGEHYLDALTLLNRATAALEEIERDRARRATEQARRLAAEARERAERERALNAAPDIAARMEFASIPPGEFRMGLSPSNRRRIGVAFDDWWRRTDVRLTRAFDIALYLVTQSEWAAVMGTNPSRSSECARCPVDNVSWEDVQRFLSLLNAATVGTWRYRLPTDAEWAYAARGSVRDELFARNLDEFAWHLENSDNRTHPVGLKPPNEFGLYDMIGNLQQLTQDWAAPLPGGSVVDPIWPSPSTSRRLGKVIRGCHYRTFPDVPSCGESRGTFQLDRGGSLFVGFRLVREPDRRTPQPRRNS